MNVLRLIRPGLAALSALVVAVTAGCGGSGVSSTPVAASNPGAPVLPSEGIFSALSTFPLALAAPANGALAIPLPAAGPYGGTLMLPTPATIPAGTTLALSIASSSTAVSASAPVLERARSAAQRSTQSIADTSVLFYLGIAASNAFSAPNAPGFTFTVPAQLPAANYYLALYDPLTPSLGWQLGFEGPATVGASMLTFAGPSPAAPITLAPDTVYALAVYAASTSAAPPTPAPAASPVAPATPAPFVLSSTALSLLAAGATAAVTIQDPTGYTGSYAAASSNAAVASVTISGTTLAITGVAAGTATITVSDAQARTATIAVQVTITTLPVR